MEKSWWSESFLDGAYFQNQRFDSGEEVSESEKTAMGEENLGRGKSECWGGRW